MLMIIGVGLILLGCVSGKVKIFTQTVYNYACTGVA